MEDKNLMLITTEKCNLRCSYCIVKLRCSNKTSKHFNINSLYKIDMLPESTIYKKIVLSGRRTRTFKKIRNS